MKLYQCPLCGEKYTHDQANPHAVYHCPKRKDVKVEEKKRLAAGGIVTGKVGLIGE